MTQALSQADFLDLFRRGFPGAWVEGLLAGDGGELLHANAAIGARLSQAVKRFDTNALVLTADDFALAQVTCQFTRSTTTKAVTVLPGSVYETDDGTSSWVLTTPVAFGVGDDGPYDAVLQALLPRYDWDLPAPVTAPNGSRLGERISVPARLLLDPPFGDTTIRVRQISAATGGRGGTLDLHAEDLGLPRLAGESSDQLRQRLRRRDGVITPAAVRNALARILAPLGQTATVIETFDPKFLSCFDGPSSAVGDHVFGRMAYNDPRTVDGTPGPPPGNGLLWGRYLDAKTIVTAFIVVVPNLPCIDERSVFLDSTAASQAAHRTALGRRRFSFLDMTGEHSVAPAMLDGSDPSKAGVYRAVASEVRRVRAFGVTSHIMLRGS